MKKLTIFSSIAAAALAMVGCQEKEIETFQPGNEGSTFELIAEIAQTKTTLDAETYKVAWEEGDVIYMVTSGADTPWATAAGFTYADGKFNTESTINAGTYTMNALYAVADQAEFHKNTGTTHKLQTIQTQNCANPTAHIKANDALVGTFTTTVPSDEPATVNMNHIYTLMQVDVKNNTGADINITKFEMTVPGADIAGIYTVDFKTAGVATHTSASETITVNVTNGTVEAGASLPVYFVAAPFTSDAEKGIEFKVTTESGATYTKTAKKALAFKAGQYNTTPYTISRADEVEPEPANVTWDLTKDETSEATADRIAWTSDYVEMYSVRENSSNTAANNYYPGATTPRTSTRFYKNNTFTISPKAGCTILSVEFNATSENYASDFAGSEWTNASAKASAKQVTLTPIDGTKAMVATIGGTCGFTSVVVYYTAGEGGETPEPEPKALVSISISNEKVNYYVGEEFVMPTVTATYGDASTADVTASAEFSGYDMEVAGDQTVMVSYTEEGITQTAQYDITVNEAPAEPIIATIEEFLDAEPSTVVWYKLTGTISNISNTDYGNFDLTDDTGTVYVYGLKASEDAINTSFSALGLREGDKVTLIGNREIYNDKDEVINAYYVSHVAVPYIEVSKETIYVAADATSVEFTVKANVGWGIEESEGVSAVIIDESEDGLVMTISAEFSENETAEAKTYVITFIPEELGYVKTVTIIQAAASQGGEELVKGITYTYEISNKTSVANSWNKLMGGTTNDGINISGFNNKSVLMGDLTWNISASGASSIYFSGQQIGSSSSYISSFELETNSYEGAVESITLSTCSNAGSTSIEVYVGGKQIGSTVTLPNSSISTDVVFQGESLLEGNIYIKYTVPTNKKNIKIAKITIN